MILSARPQEYQRVVDAEWDILYDKLERIHKSGAKVRVRDIARSRTVVGAVQLVGAAQ